jgi:hypothetical protein
MMEKPMTRNISTTAVRHSITFTLAALVLATAIPQAGFAATSDEGTWKVDTAHSKFSGGMATLTLGRVEGTNPAAGAFIVISKGNVYRLTSAAASDSKGVKPVDYTLISEGRSVLIGTKAQSVDQCRFRCQAGLADPRVTMTFKAVDGRAQQISDMLAYDGQK